MKIIHIAPAHTVLSLRAKKIRKTCSIVAMTIDDCVSLLKALEKPGTPILDNQTKNWLQGSRCESALLVVLRAKRGARDL